jgi:hypothetical protein
MLIDIVNALCSMLSAFLGVLGLSCLRVVLLFLLSVGFRVFLALYFPRFCFVSCPWLKGSLASFDKEFDSKKGCDFLGSLCDR